MQVGILSLLLRSVLVLAFPPCVLSKYALFVYGGMWPWHHRCGYDSYSNTATHQAEQQCHHFDCYSAGRWSQPAAALVPSIHVLALHTEQVWVKQLDGEVFVAGLSKGGTGNGEGLLSAGQGHGFATLKDQGLEGRLVILLVSMVKIVY
ncbi:hypothetical protein PUNSTDRAFT_46874 [Punctularia strigosozonata HHB-11173 SS5]|uniref:uncharacterized protein n=1 Tax=Punctularia strigosozonata (strain HHB-11173) TaxID=741275 RepID=UPI00044180D9|nr:uncharacterized protein PUNSTDRAFT_46874 [Punctularia strigosozonata HHB-11173 SS5]EIN05533.1 hypothetical protein PUNSTDRAFT_46874 [Punctularia strigosozonata HHB-11173 SS5]